MTDTTWNQQVLQHADWLRTVVRSRLAESHAADDVLQAVLADALALQPDKQEQIRTLGPWLYRLAVRAVLQFRRRGGRRRRLLANAAQRTAAWETDQPLDALLGDERRRQVRQALERLPGEDVEILSLKYVHGWDYRQITEHLGLTGHRIVYRLRRARERLKSELIRMGLADSPGPGAKGT
jgi:RNA polymerase sigma-70 factor (ECF subfamily)